MIIIIIIITITYISITIIYMVVIIIVIKGLVLDSKTQDARLGGPLGQSSIW